MSQEVVLKPELVYPKVTQESSNRPQVLKVTNLTGLDSPTKDLTAQKYQACTLPSAKGLEEENASTWLARRSETSSYHEGVCSEHGFVGYSEELMFNNTLPDYSQGESFFTVFGVFFPAATGVMAGFNMSGDLQKPATNIPLGSLAAIGTSWFLYMVFVFLLGAICTRQSLRYDFMIAEKVSLVGFLFLLGLYISSLASCMGGLYGAPRILQCIAQENVIPMLAFLGRGKGPNKTPVAAICLTSLITMAFVFIGQVNVLAPIVTINFMLTYIAVDYSYFSVSLSHNVQQKPDETQMGNTRPGDSSQPLIFNKPSSHAADGVIQSRSNGTLLEFTKDMDQLFKPFRTEPGTCKKGGAKNLTDKAKQKKAKKPAKQTLQDSFLLDLHHEGPLAQYGWDGTTEPHKESWQDLAEQGCQHDTGPCSSPTADAPRTPGLQEQGEQLCSEAPTLPTQRGEELSIKQQNPELGIQQIPESFYSKFCNHWVSFAGAIVSLIIMFVIQWIYTLVSLGAAVILYFYIGQASPGLPLGAAANFSFFGWIKSVLITSCRYTESSSAKSRGQILAPDVVSFCCCNGAKKLSGQLDQPEGQEVCQANGSWVLDVVTVPPGPEEPEEGVGRARVSRGVSQRKTEILIILSCKFAGTPGDHAVLVIDSSHNVRSSDTEIRTSGALVDSVELVTMLAGSREWASLPARHSAVPAASGVTGHVGPPAGGGDATLLGAEPPDTPSTGRATHLPAHSHPPAAGSHHRAVGSRERGKRALASPGTPAAAERTPPVLAAVSTNSAERTLGGHRGAWDLAGFDNATRMVLLPSSAETHHPAIGSSYQPSNISAVERRVSDFPTAGTSVSTTATKGGGRTLRSLPAGSRPANAAEVSTSGTEIASSSDQTRSPGMSLRAQGGGGRSATDPLLTNSPSASESASTTVATGGSGRPPRSATSSQWAAEDSTSISGIYRTLGTVQSSSVSSVRETYGVRGSRETTDFTEQVADPSLTGSHSPSEGPSSATRGSHVSFSILSTEGRTDFPSTSTSVSTTATKGGGRTLRSLPASTRLAQTTEISTTGTETISSPDHTQSSLGAQAGGDRVATVSSTDPLLTGSLSASENAFPAEGTSATGGRLPNAPLTSTPSSVIATSSGERNTEPMSDTHVTSSVAGSSAPIPARTSSLDMVLLPSASAGEPGRQSNVSQSGAGLSELPTKPLTAFPPGISMSLPSPSASAVGSSHHSLSSSSAEERPSSPITDATYSSSTSAGSGERTLHSVTDGALAGGTESSASYAETASSAGPAQPTSVEQSGTANASAGSGGISDFATETLFTRSSKMPTYSSFQNDLTSFSSSHQPSNDSGQASTSVATTVVRQASSTATVAGSSPRGTNKHSVTHQPQNSTIFTSTRSPPLPTAPMEQLGGRIISVSIPLTVMETTSPRATTTQGGSFGMATPLPTAASDAPRAGPTEAPLSPSPGATNPSVIIPAVALTTVKPPVLTTPAGHQPTPGDVSTTKAHRPQTPTATKHVYTTGESTEAVDPTTARPGKVTEENIPVTSPSEAPPASKTTVSIATTLAATKPTTLPPSSSTTGLRTSSPATDVDKCLSNPCPALATCNSTRGSYICQCPLGYELEKGKCNLVRIFIGQVPLKLNITHGKYAELLHVKDEILAMLDASLSGLPGYYHSTVKVTREANFVHVSVQSTFSLASNVTFYDVVGSVKSYIRTCNSSTEACQIISSLKPLHRVGSLCKQKDPECDKETSECTDFDGVALCQCKSGYFKYNKMDHSCRACEDGYKLENDTCVSCPFGLGGFNCGNPYQLITVVIAAAGGGLLLIMGIALIVTCCRKNKNDISKLIFKSGDFQMSPYAEYPKNPRAQEWGRETIEMQENGSTKNLLQMTDVYYSPTGLRNPELERNGLYPPYTGLPGSRHSCIYPGQYNPSFISDETRRRDYF
ncbi:hypothetical protein llap_5424 [Limosa lapponica baueri]|uniref:EGF-like domain-containing protein n=1 Tax=Limosa lapponica baueri TaxID=1758121 RepID=A0A2I0UE07_LIMLA|nr:hypothetical protein llap_5424 [Limosa lapponica baueri]